MELAYPEHKVKENAYNGLVKHIMEYCRIKPQLVIFYKIQNSLTAFQFPAIV